MQEKRHKFPLVVLILAIFWQNWVRLNKCTKTAIDWDDREIVHFLLGFSSKKGIDIETIFLAKSAGFCGFH
jgi:hypothetical protein